MNISKALLGITVLTLSYVGASVTVFAQTPDATRENLQQRVEQLESQMEAMRVELTKFKPIRSVNNEPIGKHWWSKT